MPLTTREQRVRVADLLEIPSVLQRWPSTDPQREEPTQRPTEPGDPVSSGLAALGPYWLRIVRRGTG